MKSEIVASSPCSHSSNVSKITTFPNSLRNLVYISVKKPSQGTVFQDFCISISYASYHPFEGFETFSWVDISRVTSSRISGGALLQRVFCLAAEPNFRFWLRSLVPWMRFQSSLPFHPSEPWSLRTSYLCQRAPTIIEHLENMQSFPVMSRLLLLSIPILHVPAPSRINPARFCHHLSLTGTTRWRLWHCACRYLLCQFYYRGIVCHH